ncbi:cystatin-B-like [Siphateles boraxobius]|uniref:cystatin-B-like n=1 Tax=Siphateles boraxobius TaxID=180520 RepID=UPI0040647EB4
MTDAKQILGGWSTEEPVNGEVENICIEAGKQAGVRFDVCIPKTYRVQTMCGGTNYLVKVKVGVDKYLHVKINRALFCGDKVTENSDPAVTGVQYPKTKSDPLKPEHF